MEKELKTAPDVVKNDAKGQEPQNVSQETNFYDDDVLNRPRPKKDKYSISATSRRLPTPQRAGFVRQWVIDAERRDYDARDWKPVKGQDGQPIREVMNTRKDKPDYGTYMEIPEFYFQQNQQADDTERKQLIERRTPSKENGVVIDKEAYIAPSIITDKTLKNNN